MQFWWHRVSQLLHRRPLNWLCNEKENICRAQAQKMVPKISNRKTWQTSDILPKTKQSQDFFFLFKFWILNCNEIFSLRTPLQSSLGLELCCSSKVGCKVSIRWRICPIEELPRTVILIRGQ